MNEEKFNLSLRKFLKTFGITAQREVEKAVDDAIRSGQLTGAEVLRARVVLEIEGLPLATAVEGTIELG
jgi:hypothetical protein